jgi:predicted Zn-dependent protease with MMP-like domain
MSCRLRRVVASLAGRIATVEMIDQRRFERIVGDALDALPPELGQLMDNVAIVVAESHPTEDLLGLYEGVPLTERDDYGGLVMPDVITLYRRPLCAFARDLNELVEEIGVTVVHEIAHHFGIDDDSLHAWGWG